MTRKRWISLPLILWIGMPNCSCSRQETGITEEEPGEPRAKKVAISEEEPEKLPAKETASAAIYC